MKSVTKYHIAQATFHLGAALTTIISEPAEHQDGELRDTLAELLEKIERTNKDDNQHNP